MKEASSCADFKAAYQCEPVPLKRYKDPPPDGVNPDEKYLPQAGEWFWFWLSSFHEWTRVYKTEDGFVVSIGSDCTHDSDIAGLCLPATAPE